MHVASSPGTCAISACSIEKLGIGPENEAICMCVHPYALYGNLFFFFFLVHVHSPCMVLDNFVRQIKIDHIKFNCIVCKKTC